MLLRPARSSHRPTVTTARFVAAGLLLVNLPAVQAQQASSEEDIRLASAGDGAYVENVTVTARRREENIQDVPIPIAALSGEALERAGQFRLEDLNQRLPSVNVNFQNPRQTSIAVRGLGNNPANDALESSVGVYLDNVYLGRPGMANFDLIDIEQLTLLRGPQGTLFGKNTTAGVLNVATRAPTFAPEARIESSFAEDGYYQVRGALSGGVTETLAARLSAVKTHYDGFMKNPIRGTELNGSNREGLRGQLLWKPSDSFDLRLIGDYNEESSDCCVRAMVNLGPNNGAAYLSRVASSGATFYFDPDHRTAFNDAWQHMQVRQGGYSAEANWDIGESKLTSISAYRYWWVKPINDADASSVSAIINSGQLVDDRQWSQELRWTSPTGRTLEYVGGLYYFYQSQDNVQTTVYGPAAGAWLGRPVLNNATSVLDARLHTRSISAFAQATWNITDEFSLTGGIRETSEQKNTVIDRQAPVGPSPQLPAALPAYYSGDLEREDDNLSALLSAAYKLSSDVLLYASVSHGAKSGGVNPAVPGSVAGGLPDNGTLFIEPEKADDYELGFKSTLASGKVQFNTNLYWTDVSDYQATRIGIINGVSTQILSNIGQVRSRGVEAELFATPVDGLNLGLVASFNDATYTEYPNAPCGAEQIAAGLTVCDFTGQRMYLAPRWIVNPSIGYEFALGSLTAFSNVNYAWRSSFFGSSDNSRLTEVDAYGLLNLRVGVRGELQDKQWSVSAWANNALDKDYFTSINRGSLNEYTGLPGLPRYVGLTVRVDF